MRIHLPVYRVNIKFYFFRGMPGRVKHIKMLIEIAEDKLFGNADRVYRHIKQAAKNEQQCTVAICISFMTLQGLI